MAFTIQLWAIRLFLIFPNEGRRSHQSRKQQNWQGLWGSTGWLLSPERDRSLSLAVSILSWPFTEHLLWVWHYARSVHLTVLKVHLTGQERRPVRQASLTCLRVRIQEHSGVCTLSSHCSPHQVRVCRWVGSRPLVEN